MRINKAMGSILAATALLVAACASQSEGDRTAEPTAGAAKAATTAATPAMLEKGRAIYKANCVACHGESGKGDGPGAGVLKPPPRDHTDAAYMSTLTDDDIRKIITMGGAIKGKPLMPSSPQIRGEELEALVAYVRSLSAAN
jgi:mono/diheme cytochrome c family protein